MPSLSFRQFFSVAKAVLRGAALCLPFAVPAHAGLPASVDGQALPSLAPMLEQVTPAVVNINSKTRVQVRDPFFDDPVFRRFFGTPNLPRERVQQSLGSGVIVDASKGYVLTNNHVIEGADDIAVTLNDGRTVKAKPIGADPDTDIAVLQIPAEHLTALPLADSTKLKVGDFVVAVGDPFGLGQTVTSGIISALGRSGLRGQGYQNFIQTDASINPGNSGGGLVNLRGELIGINSMIYSPSGASVGIGFAVPSNLAADVMRQLIAYGEVKRGALGVEAQDITAELARLLALGENSKGAVITRVQSGSSADQAGLKPGDVVTALNNKTINTAQDLRNMEGLTPTGAPITLGLIREGKPLSINTVLKVPDVHTAQGASLDPRLSGAQLADSHRTQGVNGVAITQIAEASRAFENGLRKGDVVVAINQRDIDGVEDFQRALAQHPRQLLLTVARGQNAFFILMK